MIVAMIFLFLFIAVCAFFMIFLFNFFIPALKIKYDINGTLSAEHHSMDKLFESEPEKKYDFQEEYDDSKNDRSFKFWESLYKILKRNV